MDTTFVTSSPVWNGASSRLAWVRWLSLSRQNNDSGLKGFYSSLEDPQREDMGRERARARAYSFKKVLDG